MTWRVSWMLPRLALCGLSHPSVFSWRVSWAGRSQLASLMSLAVGTGCWLGHLSSLPPLALQKARLASLRGSWLLLRHRLENSHGATSITFYWSKQVIGPAHIWGRGNRFHFLIRGAAKKAWTYLICHIRGRPSLAEKMSLWSHR